MGGGGGGCSCGKTRVAFGARDSHGNTCRGGEGGLGGGAGGEVMLSFRGAPGEACVNCNGDPKEGAAPAEEGGGDGSLDLGKTLVAFGALASQGKIVRGGCGFGFSGT